MPFYDREIRVLVLEDDEEDFVLLEDLLKRITNRRYALTWASTFDQMVEYMKERRFDVSLIDYRLGEKNGIEAIEYIHALPDAAPCILLTGVEDEAVDNQALEKGAADYLVKTQMTPSLLERSIRYAVANFKLLNTLKQNEKNKELFFATLAHDLKTPIHASYRVIKQFQDNFYGAVSDTQHLILTELLKSNRFEHHIVDNLMAVYHNENGADNNNGSNGSGNAHEQSAGTTFKSMENVDLNQLIQELVQGDLSFLNQEKQHTITLNLLETLQPFSFDMWEIQRVLRNLIQNAIFYTPKGGHIIIETQAFSPQEASGTMRDQAAIIITDNGPGIASETLEGLFQPFFTRSKQFKHIGSGLGLYLSKNIIENHGGTLQVSSSLGDGTRFTILLPMQQPVSTQAQASV